LIFRPSEQEQPTGFASAESLARVRRLELRTRGLVDSLFGGEYASVFQGRGMEFSQVRSYQPGDDVRSIDWKVTARRGTPYVRQFVEERDLLVILMVDISGSGHMGPGHRSAMEIAHEIAAALAFAAARNNDRVGLVLVSDRVEFYEAPKAGRRHVVRLLADLVAHQPVGRSTDLIAGLDHVQKHTLGRANLFIISDFMQDHREPRFREAFGRASRKHDVAAIRLTSAAVAELPNVGWVQITDPETGRRVAVDTGNARVRRHYRHATLRRGAELEELFGEIGVESLILDTDADPLMPLAGFLRRKPRRRV
jgi:uncharacterized protein (DUF58 family)